MSDAGTDSNDADAPDAPVWDPQWDTTNWHFPPAMRQWPQWMCQQDKRPVAPWPDNGENLKSWSDPENWKDFETAADWADKLTSLEDAYAFISQRPDEPYREPADPFLMVDGDDVRDPETGEMDERFTRLLDRLGPTYCDVSRSGTGVHAYYIGELPEAYTTGYKFDIDEDDPEAGHVEIYHGKRQYICTGQHVMGTPDDVCEINDDVLQSVSEAHGNDTSANADAEPREIDADPQEAREQDFTTDWDDIMAVVEDLSVHEMRMKSNKTRTRNNGDEDWDPAIPGESTSKSGTRLSVFDRGRGVHYRDGEITGDALDLVAWEAGISSPGERLRGDDFKLAVQEARNRGAPIPQYDAGYVGKPGDDADDPAQDVERDPPDAPDRVTEDDADDADASADSEARDVVEVPPEPAAGSTQDAMDGGVASPPPDTESNSAPTRASESGGDQPAPDADASADAADADAEPADGGGDGGGGDGDGDDDDDDDDTPADLYRRACDEIMWPPTCIRVVEDDNGQKLERGVDDVLGAATTFREAHLLFMRNQTEFNKDELQHLYQWVLWYGFDTMGEFFTVARGDAQDVYYFHEDSAEVVRVDGDGQENVSDEFLGLAQDVFGLNLNAWSNYVFRELIARAQRHAPERELYTFAAWDDDASELYVNAYDDTYYAVTAGDVEKRRNGVDVFFETPPDAKSYEYIPDAERQDLPNPVPGERPSMAGGGDAVMRLIANRINYSDDGALGPLDQRDQLYLHLHALPFIDMLNARPIMAFVGEKGSGKTVVQRSIGKWLFGPDFRESTMPASQEDFTTKLINRPLAFIDNYDEGNEWADDVLAAAATGTGIEMRQLYTTAGLAQYMPNCWLSLTSRTPPFRRDDVADRLLLFHIERLDTSGDDFVPEGQYYGQIEEYRDTLWSEYLDNLSGVITEIHATNFNDITSSHRMADWARLATVIGNALGVDDVQDLLDTMQLEQATFALEEEPVGLVVDEWIEREPKDAASWRPAGSLLDRLKEKQEEYNTPPLDVNTPSGVGAKLSTQLRSEMEELYDLEIKTTGRRNEYRFAGGDDDGSGTATGLSRF